MGNRRRRCIRRFKKEAEILEQIIAEQKDIRKQMPGAAEDQWTEQDAIIRDLCHQLSLLWEKIYEYQRAENTAKLLKSGYTLSEDNSITEQLCSNTRTTPIMDEFSNSEKQFLVLDSQFYIQHPSWEYLYIPISLVVAKMPDGPNYIGETNQVNYTGTRLTMSNLKSKARMHISSESLERIPDDDRAYELYQEIFSIKKRDISVGGYFPFNKPFELGGQTYEEQSGFGWEYSGRYLVREGRQYGETKKFLMIGIYISPSYIKDKL